MSYSARLSRSNQSPLAEWWRTVDHGTIAAVILLVGAGLLLSLAAGPVAADRIGYEDPFHFVIRQAAFGAVAILGVWTVSMLDARWARRLAMAVFLGAFLLMALILLVGHEAKGAQRWIRVGGFSLQPSELIKPALVVLTAWLLSQRAIFPKGPWTIVVFALFAPTIGLLVLQPDVGQAALLGAAFVVTFFVSGLPLRWGLSFTAGAAALGAALYALLPHVRLRINSFFNPGAYDTYQTDRALEAQASGGLFGVGPGEGDVKSNLPDAHTDFIYSVAGEEFGFVICLLLLAVYALVTVRGILAAARRRDDFARAAGTGLFFLFGAQAFINIGVNVALLPPKGMTLPFVSYGGSSMLGSALTIGLALALTRSRPEIDLSGRHT